MNLKTKILLSVLAIVFVIMAFVLYQTVKRPKRPTSIRISDDPPISKAEYKKIYPPILEDPKTCTEYSKSYVKACDYSNPIVRNLAVQWAGVSAGEFNIGQVCSLYENLIAQWNYVNDPNSVEYVSKASETISNKFSGDCDDFAICISSLVLAIGGEPRINIVFSEIDGHAFAEVNIGKNADRIVTYLKKRYKPSYGKLSYFFRIDEEGIYWMNLDWFGGEDKIRVAGKYKNFNKGVTIYPIKGYCNYIGEGNFKERA